MQLFYQPQSTIYLPPLKVKNQDLNPQTPWSEADVTTSRANKLAQKLADF